MRSAAACCSASLVPAAAASLTLSEEPLSCFLCFAYLLSIFARSFCCCW
jgi:hypothetical protein